jgi:hypothetical protein
MVRPTPKAALARGPLTLKTNSRDCCRQLSGPRGCSANHPSALGVGTAERTSGRPVELHGKTFGRIYPMSLKDSSFRPSDDIPELMLSRSQPAGSPFGFIEPCLPTPSRTVPDGSRWAFEFIARRDGDRVRVSSRNANDWTDKVPLIVEAMLALPVTSAAIDGEGVVVDERGLTDFERLRTALAKRGGSRAAFLYAFDLLELDGEDLRRHAWEIRRASLTSLMRKARPGVRLSLSPENLRMIKRASNGNDGQQATSRRFFDHPRWRVRGNRADSSRRGAF